MAIEEIKNRVTEGLHISRVPVDVKREFLSLANGKEFMGDYGFCLKWLIDFRKGLLTSPNQELVDRINFLAEEIEQLKQSSVIPQQEPEQKKRVIKSMSGRVITTKEEGV